MLSLVKGVLLFYAWLHLSIYFATQINERSHVASIMFLNYIVF